MVNVDAADEEVHLPLPPPVQGVLTAGPYNFQFTGEDHLRLTVANSLAGVRVALSYRTAPTPTTTQTNRQEISPTSNRVVSTIEFDVGTGYLLNVVAYASNGSPRRGQTYVKLEVIRGFGANAIVLGCVLAGSVTANQPLAWPGSPIESSTDGPGYIREFFGTGPALGTELLEAVPSGARWALVSFRVGLVSDATAVQRRPGLYVDDGANTIFRSPQTSTQGASLTVAHYWEQIPTFNPSILSDVPIAPWATDLIMLAGWRFRTSTNNLQAGDQYASSTVVVREWLEV